MGRRMSRETAMKLLYQMEIRRETSKASIELMIEETGLTGNDKEYVSFILNGVAENLVNIDQMIEKYLKGWKINRLSKVDLSILRLAVFEIFNADDIPVNVSINEAVEIAKKYSTDESASFINGVLSKLCEASNVQHGSEEKLEKDSDGN